MYNIKRFNTTPENEQIQHAVNAWQKDPRVPVYKGKHHRARPYIPLEINGTVKLLCPDTGKQLNVPPKMIKHYERIKNDSQ